MGLPGEALYASPSWDAASRDRCFQMPYPYQPPMMNPAPWLGSSSFVNLYIVTSPFVCLLHFRNCMRFYQPLTTTYLHRCWWCTPRAETGPQAPTSLQKTYNI